MIYSKWLQENPETVQGAMANASQQQNQSASVVEQAPSAVSEQQPTQASAEQQPAQAAEQEQASGAKNAQTPQKQTAGQQFQKYSQIAQAISAPTVHSSSGAMPSTLRESAFRSGPTTQSDSPQISRPGATGGRIDKIKEVIGMVFSMGGSAAGEAGGKYGSRNGGNAGEGAGSSVVGQ